MIDCISVENMRLSDAYTIENFVPSLVLMHRAAYGVYLAHSWSGRTAIVAGSGNNGGDGYALACILKDRGHECHIFTVGSRLSEDSAHYAAKAQILGVPVSPMTSGCLAGFDTVVDCLLGTGFRRPVREDYCQAIDEINTSEAFVLSVDINSGMDGDTGESEIVVNSDLTVTIGFVKQGLVTQIAGKAMKRLVCADIGIRLLHQQGKICSTEDPVPGAILCPSWLDMNIIPAQDTGR